MPTPPHQVSSPLRATPISPQHVPRPPEEVQPLLSSDVDPLADPSVVPPQGSPSFPALTQEPIFFEGVKLGQVNAPSISSDSELLTAISQGTYLVQGSPTRLEEENPRAGSEARTEATEEV